uniref:(northern house mosquito) hypothetical protein n=1 Tax=Culex pipiens TaxID=7175 RepID=A0A8D8EUC0_CULPI
MLLGRNILASLQPANLEFFLLGQKSGLWNLSNRLLDIFLSRRASQDLPENNHFRRILVQERHVKVLSHIHSNFPDHDNYFVLRKTSHGQPVWEVFVSWPEYLIARIITLFGTVLTFYKNSQHFFSLTAAKSRPLTSQSHNL